MENDITIDIDSYKQLKTYIYTLKQVVAQSLLDLKNQNDSKTSIITTYPELNKLCLELIFILEELVKLLNNLSRNRDSLLSRLSEKPENEQEALALLLGETSYFIDEIKNDVESFGNGLSNIIQSDIAGQITTPNTQKAKIALEKAQTTIEKLNTNKETNPSVELEADKSCATPGHAQVYPRSSSANQSHPNTTEYTPEHHHSNLYLEGIEHDHSTRNPKHIEVNQHNLSSDPSQTEPSPTPSTETQTYTPSPTLRSPNVSPPTNNKLREDPIECSKQLDQSDQRKPTPNRAENPNRQQNTCLDSSANPTLGTTGETFQKVIGNSKNTGAPTGSGTSIFKPASAQNQTNSISTEILRLKTDGITINACEAIFWSIIDKIADGIRIHEYELIFWSMNEAFDQLCKEGHDLSFLNILDGIIFAKENFSIFNSEDTGKKTELFARVNKTIESLQEQRCYLDGFSKKHTTSETENVEHKLLIEVEKALEEHNEILTDPNYINMTRSGITPRSL